MNNMILLIARASARVFASLITTEINSIQSETCERSEHTSEASGIKRKSKPFSQLHSFMITESPFPHSLVRTLAQNIATDMRAISNEIADTPNPIARDELLSQLMLFQGSLSLLHLATIREDRFVLQRAIELLQSH